MGQGSEETNLVPLTGQPQGYEVLTVDETEALRVDRELMDFRYQAETLSFAIAERLHDVQTKRLFLVVPNGDGGKGYEKFEDYVRDRLHYQYRTAKYLVAVWKCFGVKHPEYLERAKRLGWSKAKELPRVINEENAEEWFELAEKLKTVELINARRAALKAVGKSPRLEAHEETDEDRKVTLKVTPEVVDGEGEEPDKDEGDEVGKSNGGPKTMGTMDLGNAPKASTDGVPVPTQGQIEEEISKASQWKRYSFAIHEDLAPMVDEALDCAGKQSEGRAKDRGFLLAMVCMNYCAGYSKHPSIINGRWLRQMEELTGLRIVAVDERKGKIVYGEDSAEDLAGRQEEDDGDQQGDGDTGDRVGP